MRSRVRHRASSSISREAAVPLGRAECHDHPWHKFVRVEATDDPTFDPDHAYKWDIAEFLVELENAHRAGWDEMNVREDLARQLAEQKRILKQQVDVQSNNGDEHEDNISSTHPT